MFVTGSFPKPLHGLAFSALLCTPSKKPRNILFLYVSGYSLLSFKGAWEAYLLGEVCCLSTFVSVEHYLQQIHELPNAQAPLGARKDQCALRRNVLPANLRIPPVLSFPGFDSPVLFSSKQNFFLSSSVYHVRVSL